MKVVVGLGNPGSKYSGTRHNIGFEVVEYLARGPGVGSARGAFQSHVVEVTEGSEKVLLVKPETFMNLSGRAVRAILDFYKLTAADVLVICDDINLPIGKLRARSGGSAGGQNGLKNIQEQLGTDQYARLRIGVGQPAPGEAVDYVLGRFKPGERPAIEDAVAKAAQAAIVWVRNGIEACANLANGPGDQDKKPKKPRPVKEDGTRSVPTAKENKEPMKPMKPKAEPD